MPGQTTGLYLVEADIKDGGAIPTGASVKVRFVSERAENALTVPTDCVYYDGGHTYIYTVTFDREAGEAASVMEGNAPATVHKIEITTGMADSEKTEVTGGITKDDNIVSTWTAQLYEGAKVQVLGGNN